ncbi:MAG TPA: response regulator [Chitinophagaceae bacterium]|jgi:CheY-like chemotaxis protein|nr:response regulator [Chitinophagaceae bacterium]
MSRSGPILIYEDNSDEQEIFREAFRLTGVANRLRFFTTGEELMHYLRTTEDRPFLIISNVGSHLLNGLEVRRLINEDQVLRRKSIPFIFFSTTAEPHQVHKAFDLSAQGYFLRPTGLDDLTAQLKLLVDYWKLSLHPNVL